MNFINYQNKKIAPSKVVCIGRNYVAHIQELNNIVPDEPVIFLKPNSAISEKLKLADHDDIHYEGEISFLIQNGELSGVGFGLDLTKRDIQSVLKAKGLPWERAKAFDYSVTFSDFVSLPKHLTHISLTLEINGKLVQQGGVSLMLNSPTDLMNEVASFMTLCDGDILMTGTPSGVGIVTKGDVFIGRIFNGETLIIEKTWAA